MTPRQIKVVRSAGVFMLLYMALFIIMLVLFVAGKVSDFPMDLLSLFFAVYVAWFIIWVLRNTRNLDRKWKVVLIAAFLWQIFNTIDIARDIWKS